MSIELVGPKGAVREAIENFSSQYHEDYFETRRVAGAFLRASAPNQLCGTALHHRLQATLTSWGAGVRGAPGLVTRISVTVRALSRPDLYADLQLLYRSPLDALTVTDGRRRIALAGILPLVWDDALVRSLQTIAAELLTGNTNVTYPMKAMLLLCGLMPAFDSQVRKGMSKGGLVGMSSTQMQMPTQATDLVARKITALPYWLGHCWSKYPLIRHEARHSAYPQLQEDPGRLFDILFFMQASSDPFLVWKDDGQGPWYLLN
jgi:hypothetical protein